MTKLSKLPTEEGFIPFRGYKTWYRIVGNLEQPGKFPLLCLHGGPGFPHDYLEPLEAIADIDRRVIFYDQLGCGNSNIPADRTIYTMNLYLEEVEVIRRALGMNRFHLLGHSWGGMLALEYALQQSENLASLILSDTAASSPQWVTEMRHMVDGLPPDLRKTILKHEAAGTTNSSEYQDAVNAFFRLHSGVRLAPRPEYLKRMADKPGDDVYHTMWGPSEFYMTGTLKDWDITNRLGEIRVPSLVMGGRYDHATPLLTEALHNGLPNSEWIIFENSGHFPHIDETERYIQVLDQFLGRVEKLKT